MPTKQEILDLWNVSRIALAGGDTGRHARMSYVQRQLIKTYPKISPQELWLQIDENTRVTY